MSNRWALVIGSQCDALNRTLSFVSGTAGNLARTLHDRGNWRHALDDTDFLDDAGALIDPDAPRLNAAVKHAFIRVGLEGGQLLIAFVGHGFAPSRSTFYLLAKDSPTEPNSDTALDIGTRVTEALTNLRSFDQARIGEDARLDGLVVLLDACQAGAVAATAATRWVDVVGSKGGRLEVLLATEHDRDAYGGCFTTTMLETMETGIPGRDDNLRASDFLDPINRACQRQRAQHLAYTAGIRASPDQEDLGLWLVNNAARVPHALVGRPAVGLLDQVTRGVVLSLGQRERVEDLFELGATRLRAVVGSAGSGKTTVMAFLVRPDPRSALDVGAGRVSAAIFLDSTSTPESIAAELAAQLRAMVKQFAEHHAAVANEIPPGATDDRDATDRELILPLRRRTDRDLVRILFDGIEQVDPGQSRAVLDLISRLSAPDDAQLSRVRVIVGARSNFALADRLGVQHAQTVTLPPPAWADVSAAITDPVIAAAVPAGDEEVPGGWLTVRLAAAMTAVPASFAIADLARSYIDTVQQDRQVDRGHVEALLLLLAAAGTGPVLPITVLQRALRELGHDRPLAETRTVLSALGPLVQRGNPGQQTELVGLAHAEIANAVIETIDDDVAAA